MIPGRRAPGSLLAAAVLLAACSGQIMGDRGRSDSPDDPAGGGDGTPGSGKGSTPGKQNPGDPGVKPGDPTPTPKPMPGPDGVIDSAGPYALRRLTLLEYHNTVRDLVGVNLNESDSRGFAADQVVRGGFGNGAAIVSSVDSRQLLEASTKVADMAVADMGKLMPAACAAPAAGAEADCVSQFVDQFGLRAFRRPLSSAESGAFAALFTKLRGSGVGATYPEAVHDLLLAFLQSPEFLYRWELQGDPVRDSAAGGLIKFGPYEVASRLSYFLWASMPDDQLFAAAKAGTLDTPEQIAAQAERMLKDDRAKDGLRDFHMQWLGLYGVDELEKDPVFKTYSPEVAKAMLAEAAALVDATLLGPAATGKLEALMTSGTAMVNGPLAAHYGVTGVTGAAFQKVELPATQRAGILTRGAFLARHSKEVDSFPIARGVFLLRNVLCQDLPEPMIQLPPPPEQMMGVTTRKLYEDFTKASACQTCHAGINGAGFAFENYDAAGGYRAMEEGQAVDATGALDLPSGKVAFKDGVDLSHKLATTPELRECVARTWMRSLLRREEMDVEGGSLKAIQQAFASSNYDLRALIVALTKTRAFTHHSIAAAAGK